MNKYAILFFCFAAFGCKKENASNSDNGGSIPLNTSKIIPQDSEGDLVLGAQLQNPYTVANMITAATAIQQQGYTYLLPNQISTTHYYVKFSPSDSDQYEQLSADSNLKAYDYPLDYEITQAGNRYHDPNLPASTPTYQYAAVKTNYVFPLNITHQVLAELYIPEEDNRINKEIPEQEEFLDKLLDKAYIQTSNFLDTIKAAPSTAKVTKSKYFPGGKIQVWDTRLKRDIGLEGVEIRVRRWFTTYSTRTDFNGNYRISDDFKRDCNYSLWFNHNDFTIREHNFNTTFWIDGPKQTSDWNINLRGYNQFVAHIYRAGFRYHYGFIDGLQRPFRPSGNRTIYVGKDNELSFGSGFNPGIVPIIRVGRYFGTTEYSSDEIFSTTCHETAHTTHIIKMNAGLVQYLQVSTQLRESWATAVEWWLTKLEYKNTRGEANYGDWNNHPTSPTVGFPNDYAYQYWHKGLNSISSDYTSIYINLIDSHNEYFQKYGTRPDGSVNDQVNGFTLAGIESNS